MAGSERAAVREYAERFWARVDKGQECWLWTGKVAFGYGTFHPSRTYHAQAHRFSFELAFGPILDGLTVEHRCHTEDASCEGGDDCPHRRCVNPEHLEMMTMRENVLRSRTSPSAVNARKTHCIHGHPFAGKNLFIDRQGRRVCVECKRRRDLARYHAGLKPRGAA
jgi:hypothetical protein